MNVKIVLIDGVYHIMEDEFITHCGVTILPHHDPKIVEEVQNGCHWIGPIGVYPCRVCVNVKDKV